MYIIRTVVLASQYLLLYYYARRKSYPAQRQFLCQVAALFISIGFWIGSYFLESSNPNEAMRIAKFGLWYGAIAIEMGSNIIILFCCRVTGFRRTHLTERFSTLTLLILGEGVIGFAITLQGSKLFFSK
jgi:low temperature requirement protein LtrA